MAGNIVHSFCSWSIIVVIARLGNTEALGSYALALAISAPVYALAGLNLRSALVADVREQFEFADYLLLRLFMVCLAILITAAIGLLPGHDAGSFELLVAISFWQAVNLVSDVYYGLLQRQERMEIVGKSLMLKGIGGVVAMAVAMRLTHSVSFGVTVSLLARAVVLIFYDVPHCKTGSVRWPRFTTVVGTVCSAPKMRVLGRLFWLCLPLGIVIVLFSLGENIPRYYISGYLGKYSLGSFRRSWDSFPPEIQ